jgi:hypothetical protein
MNAAAKKIIRRNWSADADLRDSFDDILSSLERIKFKITSQVDFANVAAYVASVRGSESE